LMTMPPPEVDPRPLFEQLRDLRDRIADELGRALPVLSMGMSGDFETAIACGATHVRIGTAIFGERPKTEPTSEPDNRAAGRGA
jgi:PLP dependent protein